MSTASSECSAEWNAMTDPRSVSLPEGRDERAEWPSGDRPAAPRRARPRAENAVAGLACVEAYGWHREPTPFGREHAARGARHQRRGKRRSLRVHRHALELRRHSHGVPRHAARRRGLRVPGRCTRRLWADGYSRPEIARPGRAARDAVDRVRAGSLDVLAVGGAVGAVALVAEIHSWEAWPLGAFAATALYLLGASVQLTVVARRRRRTARTSGAPGPD